MASSVVVEPASLVVHLGPTVRLTERQFLELCRLNRDLRIEQAADGDIIVTTPAGGRTGARNAEITFQLRLWAGRERHGVVFDSSTGFCLPNGAIRAPDAAWVLRARLDALPEEAKDRFLPLCPDFAVELRSPSDDPVTLRDKMEEYRVSGARLGWLIDPVERHVHVYGGAGTPRRLESPLQLSGDPVLPGFVLDLGPVWAPDL